MSELSEPEIVEDFFGVYLLYCLNPKFKGRTYIGYTRDPNRRIKQHNRGIWAGGAYKTNNRGPWKMALIVHGFPNNISALRFEWAWQNPTRTIRLQHLSLKRIPRKESEFQFKLRVMSEMLKVGPWCRLPLIIRWLEKDIFEQFSDERMPPKHIPVVHGQIKSRNLKKCSPFDIKEECLLCSKYIFSILSKLTCLNQSCKLIAHITCLAELFLSPGDYVPIEGDCPFCSTKLKWGDLIRKLKGCSQNKIIETHEASDSELSDEEFSAKIPCDEECREFSDEKVYAKEYEELSDEEQSDDEKNDKDSGEDFKIKAVEDDQPSWFMDCNEDL